MNSKRMRLLVASGSLAVLAVAVLFVAHFSARAAANASWGFSVSNLDKSCKACDNFYEFAMGGWMKANPIPAEYPSWGTFTQLRDSNLTAMHSILDAAAAEKAKAGTDAQKI